MTTPNEELIAKLSYYSGDGVQIDMARQAQRQAADALQSQAERIKALELDLDVQAGSIEAVQTVNARQAERIKELEAAPQVGYFYKWKEAMHGIARLMDERDTLRAQLAAIAASHAGVVRYCGDVQQTGTSNERAVAQAVSRMLATPPRPMPAQDVTELVEALEKLARLGNGEHYGNSDGNMIARTALAKHKGAK